MKATEQIVACPTLGADVYLSPEVAVSEIFNEGVLCVSGIQNEGWTEETPEW